MPGKNEQVSLAEKIHHRPYRRQADAGMPGRGKQETEQAAGVSEDVAHGKQALMGIEMSPRECRRRDPRLGESR